LGHALSIELIINLIGSAVIEIWSRLVSFGLA